MFVDVLCFLLMLRPWELFSWACCRWGGDLTLLSCFYGQTLCTIRMYGCPLAKNPARLAEPGQVPQISRLSSNFPALNFSRLRFFSPIQNNPGCETFSVHLEVFLRISDNSMAPIQIIVFFNVDWSQNHVKTLSGGRFLIPKNLFLA